MSLLTRLKCKGPGVCMPMRHDGYTNQGLCLDSATALIPFSFFFRSILSLFSTQTHLHPHRQSHPLTRTHPCQRDKDRRDIYTAFLNTFQPAKVRNLTLHHGAVIEIGLLCRSSSLIPLISVQPILPTANCNQCMELFLLNNTVS